MNLADIQQHFRENRFMESRHARNERLGDNLTLQAVEDAVADGQILEQYSDTGRGESCLIVGISSGIPIHVVCGWSGPEQSEVVIITVYRPGLPKFSDPWTRQKL